jgi:hypothetical protein
LGKENLVNPFRRDVVRLLLWEVGLQYPLLVPTVPSLGSSSGCSNLPKSHYPQLI